MCHRSPTDKKQNEVMEGLSEDQLKEFRGAFKMFDVNGDGTVSREELCMSMRILGGNPTDKELEAIMSELDKDDSDGIDFEEFVTVMVNYLQDPQEEEQELREAFQVFDRNGDGVVSVDEIRAILKTAGKKMSVKDVEEMLRNAGITETELDYEEFVKLMTSKQL